MSITNIIDRRKRPYRFREINAVVKATAHDNNVADANQSHGGGPDYTEFEHASLADVILWTQTFAARLRFLYDEDGGIYAKLGDEPSPLAGLPYRLQPRGGSY